MKKIIVGAVCLIVVILISVPVASSLAGNNSLPRQLELGNKYLLEGNYEEAILAFERAIRIDPRNIDAHMGLSKAYIALDELEEAKAPLYVVIDIEETHIEAYLLLAEVLEEQENIEEAYRVLDAGIQATHEPELYLALADLKFRQGNLEEAMLILEEGIARTGSSILKNRLDEIRPTAPIASAMGDYYTEAFYLELESSVAGWAVYYTTDGTDPVANGKPYYQAISIEAGETILKAVSISDRGVSSDIYKYIYVLQPEEMSDESDELTYIDIEIESRVLQASYEDFYVSYNDDYSEVLIYVVKGTLDGRNVTLFMTEGGVGYDGVTWYCSFSDAWSRKPLLMKELTDPPWFDINNTRGEVTPREYLLGDFQNTTDIIYLNEYLRTYHQFSDEDIAYLHASGEIRNYGMLLDFYKYIIPEDEWYIVPDTEMRGIMNNTYVEAFIVDGREVLLFVDVISYKILALDQLDALDLITGRRLYDRDNPEEDILMQSDPTKRIPFAEYFKDIPYERAYDIDALINFYRTNIPEEKQYMLPEY